MTIRDLIESDRFTLVHAGKDTDREIRDVFCCDLLSVAMSKGTEGAVWVTVMGNINTLAVLTLTDMACILLAEGATMDASGRKKAEEEGITILATDRPIFTAALEIYKELS